MKTLFEAAILKQDDERLVMWLEGFPVEIQTIGVDVRARAGRLSGRIVELGGRLDESSWIPITYD